MRSTIRNLSNSKSFKIHVGVFFFLAVLITFVVWFCLEPTAVNRSSVVTIAAVAVFFFFCVAVVVVVDVIAFSMSFDIFFSRSFRVILLLFIIDYRMKFIYWTTDVLILLMYLI